MTIQLNARLDEQATLIQASSMVALASTAGVGLPVSLKGYSRMTIILDVLNATTVTGGVIVLKQAKDVSKTGEKALAFSRMLSNIDVGAGQAMTETAVVSNTFTTDTTNSKRLRYVIEVNASDLDINNGFCVAYPISTLMASAIGLFTYVLWGSRYGGGSLIDPTAN